jgi:creatinine amidohydrolase
MNKDTKILNIQHMGTAEIQQFVKEGWDTILIPMGSCERHGNPFTPLGLDGIVSNKVVEITAHKADVLHTPLIPFGYAPEHFGFMGSGCGTVSFRAETYRRILEEIARCLIYHGFNKLIFVSLHSSNMSIAEEVLFSLRSKTGAFVCFYGGRESGKAHEILQSSPSRLSSDIEASIAMALMEDRFNTKRYFSHGYNVHGPKWLGPSFSKTAGTGITLEFQGSRNILLGMDDYEYVSPIKQVNPLRTEATPEKGRMLLDALSEHLIAFIKEIKNLKIEVKDREYPDKVR